MEQYFTLAEVAELLKYSQRSVTQWIKDGKLKAVKPTGNRWRVSETELKRFMNAGGESTPLKEPPPPVKSDDQLNGKAPPAAKKTNKTPAKKRKQKTAKEKKRKREADKKAAEQVANNERLQACSPEERKKVERELSKAFYEIAKMDDESKQIRENFLDTANKIIDDNE